MRFRVGRFMPLSLILAMAFPALLLAADPPEGIAPIDDDGKRLNLDFESGTLEGWVAQGDAFKGQPVRGDTVHARRGDSHSRHEGDFWIGTFEVAGDRPRGTLTSATFKVTHPFASFLVGGGQNANASRVELVSAKDKTVLFQASGEDAEDMRPAVADLGQHVGEEIFIRLVDNSGGGWGHINFDHFRFHASKPSFPGRERAGTLDVIANAGLSPEEAALAMTVPEGFRVQLFAGEPDVHQPIAMAIDDRGRLWVAEAYGYPQRVKDDKAADRILIFEDSDGDGHFDSKKVFADKLNLVSGLELGFGGVWVGSAPHLLFIPDADGDDVPDGPPQILLDGWGYQDTHETLNAFTWGPDGWLYGCHGVFTHSLVGKPDTPKGKRTPINAGIWRYHPTRHEFEVFAHGTSNPWGVDFDEHGQAVCTACVIPHLFHIIQGARYHRQAGQHFERYTYDDIKTVADHVHWLGERPHAGNNRSDAAGGGHAHAGAMIYQGGAWPEEYRGRIFMNNIHGARINTDILEPRGSGLVGHHGPDFCLANDSWSQILNLYYGPDGQAYMIDWYDNNQCHRLEIDVHDRSNGRIFKIVYGDPQPVAVDLKKLDNAVLVGLLTHENDWYVRHARRLLQERAQAGQVDAASQNKLMELALAHPDETRRLRALWALHAVGGVTPTRVAQLLDNDSPFVRAWTIQLALEQSPPDEALLARLVRMARADDSPVVRLYLASAAQKVAIDKRSELVQALVAHGEDAGDHNLPLMYWYAAEPLAEPDMSQALAVASDGKIPLVLEFMVRRVGAIGTPRALDTLVAGLAACDDDEARQLVYVRGINEALKGRRRVDMPQGWSEVAQWLMASKSPDLTSLVESLSVTFGDPAALARVRELVVDSTADLPTRRVALATLLGAKDPELAGVLQKLLADETLRAEALRGLALYDDPLTAEAIIAVYARLTPAERRDALNTLAARAPYTLALLDAIAAGKVASSDISADLVRQMRNLKHADIDTRLGEVWGTVRETSEDRAKLIAEYKQRLERKPAIEPDPTHGRAIFAKTCAQCHALFGAGGKVGPELTGSNRANLEYVLSNVLDPSALISKDYTATVIATDDGRVVTGIVKQENDQAVTVVTANETIVIPQGEIDQRELSAQSMMPDDIFKPLSDDDIRALIAYLASPAQVPMLATADNATSLFNGKDLAGWSGDTSLWSVEEGELVGRSQGLDHNEFLMSDLAAGDFRLKLKVKLVNNAGNSGIQFRSEPLEHGEMRGYQADIGVGWWGKLYEENGRGLLWKASGEKHLKPGEWNDYEVVAVGDRLRTYLNGKLCVDLEDAPGAKRGIFALQLHSGPATEVRFKDFQLEVDPTVELARESQDKPATRGGE
ncbi:MAG: DUF1080 domain-containing protein [Pirellulales bacterium]|nr:DUF1080 domain-containing protein [Pirellulales bacterium]